MSQDDDFRDVNKVLMEAFRKYMERDTIHKGAWKDAGWRDSLLHVRSKASRILRMAQPNMTIGAEEALIDDALDLINYTAFFIINYREGREGSVDSGL